MYGQMYRYQLILVKQLETYHNDDSGIPTTDIEILSKHEKFILVDKFLSDTLSEDDRVQMMKTALLEALSELKLQGYFKK